MDKVILSIIVLAFLAMSEAAPGQRPGPQPHHDRPNPGDHCDPDECVLEGDCLEYWWCERDVSDHKGKGKNGTWHVDHCDNEAGEDNMYWDPEHNGGACNWWENLSDATKDKYNKDPNCINPHCEFKADPDNECSSTYWWFHPDHNDGKDVELHCPNLPDGEQLIWDQSRKGCHHCSSVHKDDGSDCC